MFLTKYSPLINLIPLLNHAVSLCYITHRTGRKEYREDSLTEEDVFGWHKKGLGGSEDVEVDRRSDLLVTMKTNENVETVRTFVFWKSEWLQRG